MSTLTAIQKHWKNKETYLKDNILTNEMRRLLYLKKFESTKTGKTSHSQSNAQSNIQNKEIKIQLIFKKIYAILVR